MFPSARADPPPLGRAVNFLDPMVVCKTRRELEEQLGVERSECDVNTVSDVMVSLTLGCQQPLADNQKCS
jgi:hypothetical protein